MIAVLMKLQSEELRMRIEGRMTRDSQCGDGGKRYTDQR
jgi:hypothetical protein